MRKLFLAILVLSLCLPCTGQDEIVEKDPCAGITFTFPWANYYRYVDHYRNAPAKKFGFFGIGFSAYYKKDIHKISWNVSTSEDLSSPVAAVNYAKADVKTSIAANIYEMTYHRPLWNSDFGMVLGFNFSSYTFRLASTLDSVSSYKQKDNTLGGSFGIEYRFNKHYSVAGIYRPALASFETDEFYRHVINIELRIDLDLKRKRKNSSRN